MCYWVILQSNMADLPVQLADHNTRSLLNATFGLHEKQIIGTIKLLNVVSVCLSCVGIDLVNYSFDKLLRMFIIPGAKY